MLATGTAEGGGTFRHLADRNRFAPVRNDIIPISQCISKENDGLARRRSRVRHKHTFQCGGGSGMESADRVETDGVL